MSRDRTAGHRRGEATRAILLWSARLLTFAGHYLVLLLRASLAVTLEIITPGTSLRPAIVEFRLRARTPWEVSVIAHLINLTPGTLVLEVRDRPRALYVHGMFAADVAAFRRELRDLEGRILHAIRPPGKEDR
ncbi:MAG: Na+/H+ antiporter subunit E [Micromonosporaceae bacterium]|nr:Na+/H+ antiporter subunit E [Micromonosporaceae bacterium]